MSTQSILLEHGRVVDPSQQIDKIANLLLVDGKVAGIDVSVEQIPENAIKVDASNKIVAPGLVDMHAHLREPGDEESETVATGAHAALCGGFTSIASYSRTCQFRASVQRLSNVLHHGWAQGRTAC